MARQHSETVLISAPYEQAYDRALASLEALGNHKVNSQDRNQGRIVAATRLSMMSWGEEVRIELQRGEGDGTTTATVASKPLWPLQLTGGKRNRENVEKITSRLRDAGGAAA